MGRDRHNPWKGSTEKVKLLRFAKVHRGAKGFVRWVRRGGPSL